MSKNANRPRSFNAKRARAALLAALRGEVAALVRQERADALIETLSVSGYEYTGADFTCPQIGAAIVALAPLVADVVDLAMIVHTAAYLRHLGKRELGDTPTERASRELAEHRAQATLDRADTFVLARFLLRMNENQAAFWADGATSAEVH